MSGPVSNPPVPIELDLPASLRRHPVAAICVFLLVLMMTAAVIFLAPRKFRSTAKLFLKIGRESVTVDPTASSVGDPLSVHLTREHEMQTALGIMQSREILGDVVNQIGAETILDPATNKDATDETTESQGFSALGSLKALLTSLDPIPTDERAIRNLEKDLYIDASGESSVVSIGYVADAPELAQSVVAAWIENYRRRHSDVYHDAGSFRFFETQSGKIKDELSIAREKLRDAKTQYGLVTIEGHQAMLEEQLATVSSSLVEVESEMAALTSRVRAYDQMLASSVRPTIQTEVSGKANEGRDEMRGQLFALELDQKNLQSKLTAGHPKLLAIGRQIEEAKSIVGKVDETRNEITYAANPAYQILSEERMKDEAVRQGLADKRDELRRQIDSINERFDALNSQEGELALMNEEVRILESRYSAHADRLEQARMNDVLAESNLTSVAVVQEPTLQYRPVAPNKPIVAVTGLAAAMAAAIAMPVWLDRRRRLKMLAAGELDQTWDFEAKQARVDAEIESEIPSTAESVSVGG